MTKPANGKYGLPLHTAGGTLIQRDVVVSVNVTVGKGASASTVPRSFRVVTFMISTTTSGSCQSKKTVKIWKKEEKPYKLKIWMLDKDDVNEYSDVGLCDFLLMTRKASAQLFKIA